ncbi:hypothetical protein HanIR_Chr15g0729141 [Helianthus annuus]|nr:hypothetical protein HanIR_Chr15g0729141 [Helianthus annuus]
MLMQPRMKCYTVAVEHDLRGFYRVKSGESVPFVVVFLFLFLFSVCLVSSFSLH